MKWLNLFLCASLLVSCQTDSGELDVANNLRDLLTLNVQYPLVKDQLIACAAGGGDVLVNDAEYPVSILFYPKENSSQFLYYESESEDIDPLEYENYRLLELEDAPILNGYLRKFRREALSSDRWGIVVYKRNNEIHISNPIHLQYNSFPTENNPNLVQLDTSQMLSPLFTWEDGNIDNNEIYFQVIRDENNNLISGTYTYEKEFRFYDISNVVLNIRDIDPPPTLVPGSQYAFIMMAVSLDNWVNLVLEKEFIAQ